MKDPTRIGKARVRGLKGKTGMSALKRKACVTVLLTASTLALKSGPVHAGEFCVSCTGPAASYRCTFSGDGSPSQSPGQSPGLQLTCISELAKQGGHESCTIERNRQVPCDASAKVFAAPEAFAAPADAKKSPPAAAAGAPGKNAEPVTVPPADHAADPSAASEEQPETGTGPTADPKDKPPRTVKEMVDKSAADTKENAGKAGAAVEGAAKSAGGAVQKAGAAIGNAAKKTWTCLTSLFGDC